MADWINYIARNKNVSEIEIDILNKTVKPNEVDIKPLKAGLDKLKGILNKELTNNRFETGFIKSAVMKFKIPINNPRIKKTIYCYPYLEDIEGKIYKPKKMIIETAYEVDFNPINKLELKSKEIKDGIMTKLKKLIGK